MALVKQEDISDVSRIKRVLEYATLVPGYNDRLAEDPQGVLDELDLGLTIEDISFRPAVINNNRTLEAVFPSSKGPKYSEFLNAKLRYKDSLIEDCAPDNEAMKKWRKRQVNRCMVELGAKNKSLIHTPFTLELADGCSVGCEFCGLNAGRLKSVYRYTTENAILFNDVLRITKNIVGNAAGHGTMYFATEPLDNPDYEMFLKDYRRVFKVTPQITTAVSTRYIERLRKLLADLDPDTDIIYRFSMTSLEMVKTIFKEFTPEELIFVELLPQFDEAPSNHFSSVGRAAEKSDEYGDTISCMTGFRVNMARKEIVLSTPTFANEEHPTGEYILDCVNFDDADDYEDKLKSLIRKHMLNIISPKDRLKMRDCVKFRIEDDFILEANFGAEYHIKNNEKTALYKIIFNLLTDGYRTKQEMLSDIKKDPEFENISPENVFFILNRLWEMGIIELESGKI